MKPKLIFLIVIAAIFACRNYAQRERSQRKPLLSEMPWYFAIYQDFRMGATVQDEPLRQDIFKAGRTYLILGSNDKFLCANNEYIKALEPLRERDFKPCYFIANILEEAKVSLRESTSGYLQLHERTNGDDLIRSTATTINGSAQFTVEVTNSGLWIGARCVYLKAKNGKFLGITNTTDTNIVATYENTAETKACMTVLEIR